MERAIDRVSNLSGAYFELGRLYLALHLRDQHIARQHLSDVGVQEGHNSTRGRLEQTLLAFQEAQRLGGDLPAWLDDCTNAVARLVESDYAGCVELCDRVLQDEPDVEGVWKLRADALELAGEAPFDSYDRAIEIRRSYFEALFAKANAHLVRGQLEEARRALDRARHIHPEYVDAVALLARTYLAEADREPDGGRLDTGIEIAQEAVRMDPHHYDAALVLAELKIAKGRRSADDGHWLASAVETLQGALNLVGCPNRVKLLTAQARLEQARLTRARGHDPRPELEAVMDFCQTAGARVADNQPWEAIRAEAARIIAGPGGLCGN